MWVRSDLVFRSIGRRATLENRSHNDAQNSKLGRYSIELGRLGHRWNPSARAGANRRCQRHWAAVVAVTPVGDHGSGAALAPASTFWRNREPAAWLRSASPPTGNCLHLRWRCRAGRCRQHGVDRAIAAALARWQGRWRGRGHHVGVDARPR
jgi:hypothetical protein